MTLRKSIAAALCIAGVGVFIFSASKPAKPGLPSLTPRGTPINSSPQANPASASGESWSIPVDAPGGYLPVGFDKLSAFPARVSYELVDSNTPAFCKTPGLACRIPDVVRALDSKDVAVQGFMLPLKHQNGRVKEFLLLKNQSLCCFGRPPNLNEWVHVTLAGKGVRPCMDQSITVYGTLHVGEYKENRQMLGIYRLDGDGMRIPREF